MFVRSVSAWLALLLGLGLSYSVSAEERTPANLGKVLLEKIRLKNDGIQEEEKTHVIVTGDGDARGIAGWLSKVPKGARVRVLQLKNGGKKTQEIIEGALRELKPRLAGKESHREHEEFFEALLEDRLKLFERVFDVVLEAKQEVMEAKLEAARTVVELESRGEILEARHEAAERVAEMEMELKEARLKMEVQLKEARLKAEQEIGQLKRRCSEEVSRLRRRIGELEAENAELGRKLGMIEGAKAPEEAKAN